MYNGPTKKYELENHTVCNMPVGHCVFCKKCTSLLYDYTNGPYVFFCELGLEPEMTEITCTCPEFEDDGYEFDYHEYFERLEKLIRRRVND